MTTMMFHTHPGSSRKLFAAIKDGFCRACRPAHVEAVAILDQPPAIDFGPVLAGTQSVSNSGELPTLRAVNIDANLAACNAVTERLNASHAAQPLSRAQRIQLRNQRIDAIRASRQIVLRWSRIDKVTGEVERGSQNMDANTQAARLAAYEVQKAKTDAGFKVTAQLVRA